MYETAFTFVLLEEVQVIFKYLRPFRLLNYKITSGKTTMMFCALVSSFFLSLVMRDM